MPGVCLKDLSLHQLNQFSGREKPQALLMKVQGDYRPAND